MRNKQHHLFFSRDISENTLFLDEQEARHAVSVLRVKKGDPLQVTDGRGTIFQCICASIGKKNLVCNIVDRQLIPRTEPDIILMVGIPDKDPFEAVLEHMTALGIRRIVPLDMENCRKPWWGNWEKMQERFLNKMIVSMKQCLYPYIPDIDKPSSFISIPDQLWSGIFAADQEGIPLNVTDIANKGEICCLIGPPGGFSASEIELLKTRGSTFVKIAPNRLRTELAAVVLCSQIVGMGSLK